ncbi:MAG: hypothetical protein ACREEQ_04725, partial [Caulobacteraceae bacterium]
MNKIPVFLSLATAGLMLAACGQASSPSRKAGLWEQSFQGDRNPTPIVTQACFDALWDRRMPVVPRPSKREARFCQQFNVSRSGADYV